MMTPASSSSSNKRPRLDHPPAPPLQPSLASYAATPKLYRACAGCARAKAKCEDVTPMGCHRCRSKHVECSLRGVERETPAHARAMTGGPSPSPVPSPGQDAIHPLMEDIGRRISSLENAVGRIEQSISSGFFSLPPSAQPIPTPMFAIPQRYPDLLAFQKSMLQHPSSLIWDEATSSCWVDSKNYPDVVARGLVTRSQVELAFQLFKHRFSSIIPLPKYLLTSTSPPTHPAIILAMLVYVPEIAPPNMVDLIDETILYSLTGAVNADVIHALFLLSLAPFPSSNVAQVPITPLRLISLAYEYSRNIGIDTRVRGIYERGSLEDEEWNIVLLWESIINQYNLLHIFFARRGELQPSGIPRLPTPPNDTIKQSAHFLQEQNRLIDICRDPIAQLSQWELAIHQGWLDIPAVTVMHDTLRAQLEDYKQEVTHRQTVLHTIFVELSILLRISLLLMFPPTPHSPDTVLLGLTISNRFFVDSCVRAIRAFLAYPPTSPTCPSTPAYVYSGIIAALAALRRHSVLLLRNGIDPGARVELDNLQKAEDMVAHHEGLPGYIYRNMWRSLEDGDLPDADKGLTLDQNGEIDWSALFGDFDLAGLLASMNDAVSIAPPAEGAEG